ncbi:MAG: hypothetical protein N2688_12430 [Burkholderiaceae bacterium]|nr:hypothetical protein [Burkholderiaceae bacterium]
MEIRDSRKEAGIEEGRWIDWYRDHPPEDDLKLLRWADREVGGDGQVAWRPFQHPPRGRVELGGRNRFIAFSDPPHRLRAEVERFPRRLLWQSLITPQSQRRKVRVESAEPETWRLRAIVQNTGWLPTYVTKMALQRKQARGVQAEIALPPTARLLAGRARESLGEPEGEAHLHTGASFWPQIKPTQDIAHADWIAQAPAGTAVQIAVWHERAGRLQRRLRLGETA